MPFISICIPAYRNTHSLNRLLASIRDQLFTDYELIICDDSPTSDVADIAAQYSDLPGFRYHRNHRRMGSPANWNQCLSLARGTWVKMMHHDDWFRDCYSLGSFAEVAANIDGHPLIFSSCNAYRNGESYEFTHQPFSGQNIATQSAGLIAEELVFANKIGCPSVTMFRHDLGYQYDEKLVWLVDVDFYVAAIRSGGALFVDSPLVNVTFSANTQITSTIELDARRCWRESMYLCRKYQLMALPSVRKRLENQCAQHRLYKLTDFRSILIGPDGDFSGIYLFIDVVAMRIRRWLDGGIRQFVQWWHSIAVRPRQLLRRWDRRHPR